MAMKPNNKKRSSGAPIRRQTGTINRKQKKGGFLAPVLILLAMTMIIALILAAAWEKFETEKQSSASKSEQLNAMIISSSSKEPFASPASIPSIGLAPSSVSSEASSSSEDSEASSESSSEDSVSSSSAASNEAPASSAATASSEESSSSSKINVIRRSEAEYGKPVPESSQVTTAYFDDALFVGDSITSGIDSYGIMSNATVIANTGINPSTMLTSEVWENADGTYSTLLEAASKVDAAKIYVMIGANGVAWIGENAFIDYYTQIIQRLKDDHPDAIIYVQSILPVTKEKSDEGPSMSNGKIDMYNSRILKMTEELEVYYLDVASAIKNQNGALPSEASPKDGIHFGTATYQKWFDYLRTHTVDK